MHEEMSAVGHLHHLLGVDVSALRVWVVYSHDPDCVCVLGRVFLVCFQHERCVAAQHLELVVHSEVQLQLLFNVGNLEEVEVKQDGKPPIFAVESELCQCDESDQKWPPHHSDGPPVQRGDSSSSMVVFCSFSIKSSCWCSCSVPVTSSSEVFHVDCDLMHLRSVNV